MCPKQKNCGEGTVDTILGTVRVLAAIGGALYACEKVGCLASKIRQSVSRWYYSHWEKRERVNQQINDIQTKVDALYTAHQQSRADRLD